MSSCAPVRWPNIAVSMPWTSESAVASSARSSLSRPLPTSASIVAWIWEASQVSATPPSLTIFRKKKSWPWIAVVPSYRVSILESRMYCSIG